MTINTVSNSNINNQRRQAPGPVVPLAPEAIIVPAYVRPADWLTLPTIGSTESKFVGLHAVHDNSSNYVALAVTCTGGYTVDWGDGIVQNFASAATAEHNYVYANISAGSLSTWGYRQVIVTITSTTGTNSFSIIDLQKKFTNVPVLPRYSTKWLDIAVGSTQLATLTLGTQAGVINNNMLEQFSLISCGASFTFSSLFGQCFRLQSVPVFNTTNITLATIDSNSMFYQCYSLTTVPTSIDFTKHNNFFQMFTDCRSLINFPAINSPNNTLTRFMFSGCLSLRTIESFDVSKVTNAQNMFANCPSIQYIPDLNFTTLLTNCNTMFGTCRSLVTAPFFNTFNVTTTSSMFSGCYALTSVPAYDLRRVTFTNNMFADCRSMVDFPDMDLPAATDIGSTFTGCSSMVVAPNLITSGLLTTVTSLFGSCVSLTTVKLFNTANVRFFGTMFNGCSILRTVPQLDTASATDTSGMFLNCIALKSVPLMVTTSVTNMSRMFESCNALVAVPVFNTTNVANMQAMFQSCSSLVAAPAFDTIKVTNMSSMFQNCVSLETVPTYDTANTTVMTTMFNGCAILPAIPLFNTVKVTAAGFGAITQACTLMTQVPQFNTSGVVAGSTLSTPYFNMLSLVEIPAINMANFTTYSGTFSSGNSLARVKMININASLSLTGQLLGKDAIEEVCTNLVGNVTVKTLTITSLPGADTVVAKTGNTTNNSNVIVMANTVGLATGMYVTAAGLNSLLGLTHNGISVVVASGFLPAANSAISFSAFTNVTNLSLYTIYYVKNPLSNQFSVSLTPGGAAVQLNNTSTAGTCSISYPNQIVGISSNANITISNYATFTNTAVAISGRILNTQLAIMKNWTVTG